MHRRNQSCTLIDGADEIFGGYDKYFSFKKIAKAKLANSVNLSNLKFLLNFFDQNNFYKSVFSKFLVMLFESNTEVIHMLNNSYLPFKKNNNLYKFFNDNIELISGGNDYINQINILDKYIYLPGDILTKLDRSTMAYGLEARCPFLDDQLVNLISNIDFKYLTNSKRTKFIIKDLLSKYLPKQMIEKPKKGFTLPLSYFLLSKKIKNWVEDLFTKEEIECSGLNYNFVINLWRKHSLKPNSYEAELLYLIITYL